MLARFQGLVLGLVLGAAVMFVGLKYHVVRSQEGWHLVPKLTADLSNPFLDVRGFQLGDWDEHPEVAAALIRSGKGTVVGDAPMESLRRSVNQLFTRFQSESLGH